jgi:hypothetical protein
METECACKACQGLRAECGSHYAWLARKLLQRGWAGMVSPAERAYQRAHAPWGTAKAPPTERQVAARARFGSAYVKRVRH